MTVVIDGTTGIDTVQDGAIVAADIAAGAVTQTKLASGVAGNGPAFWAEDTSQTATTNVQTKIVFDTTHFDTNGAFDGTKFQPTVAGYYQINCRTSNSGSTNAGTVAVYIYKNGAAVLNASTGNAASQGVAPSISGVLYLNGTTDYIEFYGLNSANANLNRSWASAAMVRGA